MFSNCGEIRSHPERVSNIKPFINKYNWHEIKYPSGKGDWEKFDKNNFNVVLMCYTKKNGNMSYLHYKIQFKS